MKRSLIALALGMQMFSATAFADSIKFGLVTPTTGPNTQYGDMVKEGAISAAEIINSKGGILGGKQIEFVVVDDGCEPKQGPIAANSIVNQNIKFVVGPTCSGPINGAAPILDEEGVVAITPSGTSPSITEGKDYHFFFRAIGRDDQQGPPAAKFIQSKAPKKIALVNDKQAYGKGLTTSVKAELEKLGVPVAFDESINAGDTDYSALITKFKSAGVDFVYFGGYYPELGLLLRQSREQGFNAQYMGPEGSGNPELVAIAGDAVDGLYMTFPPNYSTLPGNEEVVKYFKDKKRDAGGAFQLLSYAATQALVAGIEATKSDDPEKVADWLHANSVKTVVGDLSWKDSGDLKSFDFEIVQWKKDGSRTSVK
ncbi:high-affinity branched-chain amino acid ABC transporter substrate-binding protein [Taylorella equigenitalis]|uniref:Branched-chain amino acid ABC transporter n=1 Tax=Taylorella equigenitalis (strain MCE9) TaxID=937774 RepID=A0A654KIR0_TAYEM|nr:high-affinity branched-chain amino acid ABC transporter substrate-binding protein [Taylorella equigenitalis]ADU92290.1 Branched-chain amino acid ABC transporter [Taylorella equigenitalis MCE9]WDU48555.1 high-affinity branched-chain amino acid ABC transporter substrate-binding protein [Taylorella equigenitalis]WDU50071.1 high-affinity branched-chain amino acid ABC transporter substrate-binding protein [Taylorella equigenitalis]WDU52544.1 high-affinity branched-chain amino acid ABC transporter